MFFLFSLRSLFSISPYFVSPPFAPYMDFLPVCHSIISLHLCPIIRFPSIHICWSSEFCLCVFGLSLVIWMYLSLPILFFPLLVHQFLSSCLWFILFQFYPVSLTCSPSEFCLIYVFLELPLFSSASLFGRLVIWIMDFCTFDLFFGLTTQF